MALYNLYGGVGGGFGGHDVLLSTDEFNSMEDAMEAAHELAEQEYESYAGLHGIPSWDEVAFDVLQLNEVIDSDYDYDDFVINGGDVNDYLTEELSDLVDIAYHDEIESWIYYDAVLASEDDMGED